MLNHGGFSGARPPVDETPLTLEELRTLVRGVVRFPTTYKSAKKIGFDSSHFNGLNESPLRVFMTVYDALHEAHDGIVTKEMFLSEMAARAEDNHIGMTQRDADTLFGTDDDGLIDFVFAPWAEEAQPERRRAERSYVENILKRFLNARLVRQELKRALGTSPDNTSPTEMLQIIEQFGKRAHAVQFVGNEAVNAAVMPEFGQDIILPPPANPTTIAWIDNYIGGFRPGDIIGLLGPYSGGKTTMLTTISVRLAQQYAALNPNKLAVYICYEDGAQKLNFNLYSAAAHIERAAFVGKSSIEEFWAGLSTRETLKPYERNLPINQNGEILLSERDRWAAVQPWFNRNFVFLDFSANKATGGRGNGGVHEIVATLENLVEQTGMEIGVVSIDYAVLMLNRYLAQNANTKHQEQIWRELQTLPDELKTQVAIPLGCTIMLAHQLAVGDIKHIPPYRHVSHADAQGSKAFAENLHACLCLNAPDPETKVSTINWSKIRFDRPQSPFGLVRIDEHVVDVRDVSDEYYVNELGRRIMQRNELAPTAHSGVVAPTTARSRRVMRNEAQTADTFGQDLLS
jgi:hypothetical protein